MSQKFLTNIDLGGNELISPRIHNLTTAQQPATGVSGQIYYNTTDNKIRLWNATAWVDLGITYSTSVVDSTGIRIRLTGSDATTDDVIFTGSNITVARTDASTIALSIPQSVATTANPTFAGATLDAVRIGVTAAGEIDTSTGNLTIDSAGGTVTVDDNLVVVGNLTVNGTTTTVNSTTTTLDDPILTLGGDAVPTTDDNKDRGVEFRWHNGTAAKVGFFGFSDIDGKFKFIPDATNTSEVFTGSLGTINAIFEGNGAALTSLNATNLSTGTVAVARGGTNISSYAVGDLIYASAATTLSKLADVATGNVLISGGVNTAPSYGKVGLTTHVSGTLAVGNGGTGTTTAPTAGGVAYGASTSAIGYTVAGTSGFLLKSNGTSAPSWVASEMSTLFPAESFKTSVRFATTGNITIATGGTAMSTALTDGVTPVIGDRVLVRQQTTASENGIYLVSGTAWTRALDADAAAEIDNAIVAVQEGGSYAGHIFTNKFKSTDTLGTTAMPWYRIMFEDGAVTTWEATVSNATTALNVSGTVAIANGGTGATTAADARANFNIRTHKASIGDGTQVAFLVTHSFNTRDVMVELYDTATYETVYADVVRTSVNGVTILFNTAPTTGQIRVLIKEIA